MKKIKIVYLALGLGIGLVISSILFSFFPEMRAAEFSDEDVIKRAEELGYVTIKEKISQRQDKKYDEVDEIKLPEEIEEIEEIEAVIEIIEVKVKEGETLSEISKKLLNLGLIDEKETFIAEVNEKKMSTKFAYGTFNVPSNASYSQIIELLTR